MSRSVALESPPTLYAVGPYPIEEGTLVGEDADGRLVPVDRAVRFVGVARESHSGWSRLGDAPRVEVATGGAHPFGFVGWTPTFADKGRTVWAFSEAEVSGAPFRTALVVGKVVGLSTAVAGRQGVRVEIDEAASR